MIEELYASYFEKLTSWCACMTRDRSQAEDLVQEAFLRAMYHAALLEQLSEKQRCSWLYRTVKHLYIDKVRRGVYETAVELFPEDGENTGELEAMIYKQLLLELPEEERMIFIMRYLEGYNSRELGEFLGLSPGTIRSKLSQARSKLKKALIEKSSEKENGYV